ncbi:hypothetical protein SK128_011666 [Halocaridina rubra]|uniref:Uncharacterized protein n=1 Tax=Halocaridina rubra TaxID=373956 RepID=A0AAN8XCA9_HALRR
MDGSGDPVPAEKDSTDEASHGITQLSLRKDEEYYNMQMKKNRGMAVIFAYSEYKANRCPERKRAKNDVIICKTSFERLQYNVTVHWNLIKKSFLNELIKICEADHSECDSLVVIFMSHGGIDEKTNLEFLETFDLKVNTIELWKKVTPEKCPTLAGKPKMFFIQACRGADADEGIQLKKTNIGMSVQTDTIRLGSMHAEEDEEDYSIPLYADLLIMWASYSGMVSHNTVRKGINGSVFLHFLCKTLDENAEHEDLSSMLLRIKRQVATEFESNYPGSKKQIPQVLSTLMRKVLFYDK